MFTVVHTDAGRVQAALEVQPGAETCVARFFDASLSNDLVSIFTRTDGRLFLTQVTHDDHPAGDGPRTFSDAAVITVYNDQPSGVVPRTINAEGQPTVDISDRDGVDVSGNWEPVPRFGDWASLLRTDRRAPASTGLCCRVPG